MGSNPIIVVRRCSSVVEQQNRFLSNKFAQLKNMKTNSIPTPFLILCSIIVLFGQTKTDMKHQSKNLHDVIKPRAGTVVVCVADKNCESLPDGAYVVYRTLPPQRPGPCNTVGTGAFSVDENGYMYWCSPPWDGLEVGKNHSVWMRTVEPMVKTWVPDRPPNAPSIPQPIITSNP